MNESKQILKKGELSAMLHMLYLVFIYPIELLLEVVFAILYDIWWIPGFAIIGVSVVVNILMLPLYKRADLISDQERKKQEAMKPYVDKIRKSFKGDERFMILQTYYKKQSYKPVYALRSSLPLLLQIPFFIAAYHFLSNLNLLNGYDFFWIKDLGKPDGLFLGLNILPILMTLINVINIVIYTKGSSRREKVQLYVMAFLFLILLYNSPSGLVIYWTMNNVFSLIKNIVIKEKREKRVYLQKTDYAGSTVDGRKVRDINLLFVLGSLLMTILIGFLIPSSVIVSSPAEFVNLNAYKSPLQYVFKTGAISAGFFLVWIPIFYYLASQRARCILCGIIWVGGCVSLVDFLAFGKTDQFISSTLKYDEDLVFSPESITLNLIIVVACVIMATIIFWKKKKWVVTAYSVLLISALGLSLINITQSIVKLSDITEQLKGEQPYSGFTLSKSGKNVVVIMLDRAVGLYVPFIMQEKPELMEQYSGFIYYPNTISHGTCTIIGAPVLFGGYEYTPEAMDARSDEKLVDKHDEALRVMPVLFSENGYKTTVYDAPLGRYNYVSDLSIFDEYPDIDAYSLKHRFMDPEVMTFVEKYRERTFFMYGIFKSAPLICQNIIYDEGEYWYPDTISYPDMDLMDSIAILDQLIELTQIDDSATNTFMMMDNETPHEANMLQLPEYTLIGNINNRGMETSYRYDEEGNEIHLDGYYHYHVNIASLIRIGKWLEYLKANDVYDNTRIIVVSDHGASTGEFEDMILDDDTDLMAFCPVLMFKDFDAEGYSICDDFMTNGDTPILAMNGIIDSPVNPFTGNPITNDDKNEHEQLTIYHPTDGFEPDKDKYTFFRPIDRWYRVHDNLYDISNWTRVN